MTRLSRSPNPQLRAHMVAAAPRCDREEADGAGHRLPELLAALLSALMRLEMLMDLDSCRGEALAECRGWGTA